MKSKIFIILFLVSNHILNAQQQNFTDSLRAVINQQKGDTTEVNALAYLANEQTQPDSAIKYAQLGSLLGHQINYKKGEADCNLIIATAATNFIQGLQSGLKALDIYESLKDKTGIASANGMLQAIYRTIKDYRESLAYAFEAEQIAEANNLRGKIVFPGHRLAPLFLAEIGGTYVLMDQLDSALFYTQRSIDQHELFNGAEWNFPIYLLATIQTMQGKYKIALENYRRAIPLAIQNHVYQDTLQIFSGMSTLFKKTSQFDSSIHYAQIVSRSLNPLLEIKNLLEAVTNLGEDYKLRGNKDSAIKYIELSHTLEDSIFSKDRDREVQNITFNEQFKQQEIASAQAKYKSKIQLYGLSAGLLVLILIAVILWRSNRHKQKANIQIEEAYSELKATQTQLIQSEKMASLGELTAGIAHEIQNPLNFVNNFSEVNKELIDEMQQEMDKGNYIDAKNISNDIKENEQKINHHGKRADAIVKNMLQHSRSSSSQKEPTDINALAEEYLRLSYHGMRAKDKDLPTGQAGFNATIKTDFDEAVGKINIVPQDIGRVILNLFNNAFYATNEKKKIADENYKPTVSVQTKKINDTPHSYRVEIRVEDNGYGIPSSIKEKIFQPFFTTKPTGQGTGLGLSLAYDIIKVHGGEIKVETEEGEGTTFIIQLPFA
ncbi:MAG: ATP-binding protein [Bacteroidota bacterium]|nr:ATP-binding protein [Bacteroidota bacterium]